MPPPQGSLLDSFRHCLASALRIVLPFRVFVSSRRLGASIRYSLPPPVRPLFLPSLAGTPIDLPYWHPRRRYYQNSPLTSRCTCDRTHIVLISPPPRASRASAFRVILRRAQTLFRLSASRTGPVCLLHVVTTIYFFHSSLSLSPFSHFHPTLPASFPFRYFLLPPRSTPPPGRPCFATDAFAFLLSDVWPYTGERAGCCIRPPLFPLVVALRPLLHRLPRAALRGRFYGLRLKPVTTHTF